MESLPQGMQGYPWQWCWVGLHCNLLLALEQEQQGWQPPAITLVWAACFTFPMCCRVSAEQDLEAQSPLPTTPGTSWS